MCFLDRAAGGLLAAYVAYDEQAIRLVGSNDISGNLGVGVLDLQGHASNAMGSINAQNGPEMHAKNHLESLKHRCANCYKTKVDTASAYACFLFLQLSNAMKMNVSPCRQGRSSFMQQ